MAKYRSIQEVYKSIQIRWIDKNNLKNEII